MSYHCAGIYLRVSSEEQAQHGYSLAVQRERCRKKAQQLGACRLREFADEGVSGSVLNRPGLNQLREAVRRGEIDLVVVYDPDRFARHVGHQLLITEEIERCGARLEFVNFEWKNTPEGQMFYTIRGAVAQYEREKIRERTMAGRLQKARQGKLPLGLNPYGYIYNRQSQQLEIVEDEARVVRSLYYRFVTEDIGYLGLARWLNKSCVPTKKRVGLWKRQVVKQILTNPIYKGVFYANRFDCREVGLNRFREENERIRPGLRPPTEWISIPVPAIIEASLWEKAQEKVAKLRGLRAQSGRRDYLLRGLLQCGICGGKLYGRYSRSRGKDYFYYTCAGIKEGIRLHGVYSLSAAVLEGLIWPLVERCFQDRSLLREEMLQLVLDSELDWQLGWIVSQIEKAEEARACFLTLIEGGVVGEQEAGVHLARLQERLAELKRREQEIREEKAAQQIWGEKYLALAMREVSGFSAMPGEWKRQLLCLAVERIVVEGLNPLRLLGYFRLPGGRLEGNEEKFN